MWMCWSTTHRHEAVRDNVLAAIRRGVHVVVGSSGLTGTDYAGIDADARERGVAVIAAGNFSITAALATAAAVLVAPHLPHREIVDYASAGKTDAPSGTARELAERIAATGPTTVGVPVEETVGAPEARGTSVDGVRVHSVRLPSFTVSTEVVFAMPGERLVIRHDAGESADAVRRRHARGDPRAARPGRADPRPGHDPAGGTAMNVVTQVFALVAALFHVAVFALESLFFKRPSVRQTFGGRAGIPAEVDLWAFNQGFYNLFLAAGPVAGVIAYHAGPSGGGRGADAVRVRVHARGRRGAGALPAPPLARRPSAGGAATDRPDRRRRLARHRSRVSHRR